jgi:hypothetical protein
VWLSAEPLLIPGRPRLRRWCSGSLGIHGPALLRVWRAAAVVLVVARGVGHTALCRCTLGSLSGGGPQHHHGLQCSRAAMLLTQR